MNKQKYFNVTSDVFLTDSYENITATHHIKILIIVISTYRTRHLASTYKRPLKKGIHMKVIHLTNNIYANLRFNN